MNIYDELTHDKLDPEYVAEQVEAGKGRVYPGEIEIGQTEPVPEHWEYLPGTAGKYTPNGLRKRVPAKPAMPIYEECLIFHTFTPEELAPTWQESMEAQVLYTALMTDTLIDGEE